MDTYVVEIEFEWQKAVVILRNQDFVHKLTSA